MEEELRRLRGELIRVQEEAEEPEQQVEQLEERVTKVERIKSSQDECHMLFFRGG